MEELGLKKMGGIVVEAAFIVAASINIFNMQWGWAASQDHPDVVGTDHSLGSSTDDLVSWAADKVFRVGDNFWFAYSTVKDSVVEQLSSKEDVLQLQPQPQHREEPPSYQQRRHRRRRSRQGGRNYHLLSDDLHSHHHHHPHPTNVHPACCCCSSNGF